MRTLPEFLINLRRVFEYLINTMKYYAESGNSKARFYISNAPRTPFSTAILNVSDFTTVFNIFERHMQINAQEIINNGWQTNVSLYIFPNSYAPSQRKKKAKKQQSLYKYFGKANAQSGSGKKYDVAAKHGREVRHSVFQIGKGGVKNYCAETKTIYQFHGCFYHSCKKCYDGDAYNSIVHERFFILRSRTQRVTGWL